MTHPLVEITIGDDPSVWEAAGFHLDSADQVQLGSTRLRFRPPSTSQGASASAAVSRGVLGWAFDFAHASDFGPASLPGTDIDGIPTTHQQRRETTVRSHPNGVTTIDHIVILSRHLGRTSAALEQWGFHARRRRDVPGSEPARTQVFWWAGDVILELVGPRVDPTGIDPADTASLWGLSLVAPDIEATAASLGTRLGAVRDAVQPGRRIATVATRDLDISVPVAIMSPHVP